MPASPHCFSRRLRLRRTGVPAVNHAICPAKASSALASSFVPRTSGPSRTPGGAAARRFSYRSSPSGELGVSPRGACHATQRRQWEEARFRPPLSVVAETGNLGNMETRGACDPCPSGGYGCIHSRASRVPWDGNQWSFRRGTPDERVPEPLAVACQGPRFL